MAAEDEQMFAVVMGLIGLVGTAAGIAAIPVSEKEEEKKKICLKLFDISVSILLGIMVIVGFIIQCWKKNMKLARWSFFVFFCTLVFCFALKMALVFGKDFSI